MIRLCTCRQMLHNHLTLRMVRKLQKLTNVGYTFTLKAHSFQQQWHACTCMHKCARLQIMLLTRELFLLQQNITL